MPDRPKRIQRAAVAVALVMSGVFAATHIPSTAAASQCGRTAAETLGWGSPDRSEDFTHAPPLAGWAVYDGPGHAGNGRRTPDAVSVADGTLTITGDAEGNSGGIAWLPGRMHGRWEACVKAPPSAETYHALLLLWPDAEDWPSGGEVDFMELTDPTRQSSEFWLHYGPNDNRETGHLSVDAAQWHSWAVEWTPNRIAAFIDGTMWFETTNVAHLPPRPMHLAIQLDNFGGDTSQGAQMMVDRVHQYPID